jgi:hypothetical protein
LAIVFWPKLQAEAAIRFSYTPLFFVKTSPVNRLVVLNGYFWHYLKL